MFVVAIGIERATIDIGPLQDEVRFLRGWMNESAFNGPEGRLKRDSLAQRLCVLFVRVRLQRQQCEDRQRARSRRVDPFGTVATWASLASSSRAYSQMVYRPAPMESRAS